MKSFILYSRIGEIHANTDYLSGKILPIKLILLCFMLFLVSPVIYCTQDWVQKGTDLNGEAEGDYAGCSVSMSSDGNIVAIGAYNNDGNGNYSGHVRVYVWDETEWIQRGADIDGKRSHEYSGYSVSLNSNGDVLAIGAPGYEDDAGLARVYYWNGTAWIQRGTDINGEGAYDRSGCSVSLNSDGNTVAVGAQGNDGHGINAGHVRIYFWNGTNWNQKGADIDGEAEYDNSGYSVSLSSDGNILAVGAPFNDGNGNMAGHVRIYSWNGTVWIQRGSDIDGEAENNASGCSVSLNPDGNIIAIGAYGNSGTDIFSGHVRVYAWNGTIWDQKGSDIDGEAKDDYFGWSVCLNSDGNTLVIGAKYNDGNGVEAGHARVYNWNGTGWDQKGTDIDGESCIDNSGYSVGISADGNTVAVGAIWNDANGSQSGHVRIYDYRTINPEPPVFCIPVLVIWIVVFVIIFLVAVAIIYIARLRRQYKLLRIGRSQNDPV